MVGPPASLPIALVFRVEFNAYNEGDYWLLATTERIMVIIMSEIISAEYAKVLMETSKELYELGLLTKKEYAEALMETYKRLGVSFDEQKLKARINEKQGTPGW